MSDAVSKEIGVPSRVIPAFISPTVDEGKVPADIVRSIANYRASGKKVLALNASRLPQFNAADIYGIDLLMSAFLRSDVRERCGAVVCISDIDQNNAYLHHLRDRLRHNGLNDHILLRVGEIEFAGMLKHCDLFVRPTSTDGDAVSIREALWLGIPTVASDAVARPAGVTTFRSRDANDLARKILQTVSTKEAVAVRSDCYGEQVLETCKGLLKRQCDVE
ncbi:MAG: glycosyltransferase [Hyphomicrobium sp.]